MANQNDATLALRPREAAKLLGISCRTLWSWTDQGIIPCVKIHQGKRPIVLYPVAQLQAWLEAQINVKGGAL